MNNVTSFSTIWSRIQKPLYFLALSLMLVSAVGCGDKSKKSSLNRTHRNQDYRRETVDPRTGQTIQSDWGAIYGFNKRTLEDFLVGAELGNISSSDNARTGIRFRTNRAENTIEILVWDDIAEDTGEAYFFALEVLNNRNGVVTVGDEYGSVTFDGQFSGSAWLGEVWFEMDTEGYSGNEVRLGDFGIHESQAFKFQ